MDSLMMGGLRTAQVVSLICIVAGIVILYCIRKRPVIDVAAPPATTPPPKEKRTKSAKKDGKQEKR